MKKLLTAMIALSLLTTASLARAQDIEPPADETPATREVLEDMKQFFGNVSDGLAYAVAKTISQMGVPSARIRGSEFSAAVGLGLRYGEGRLKFQGQTQKVYWQGPSVGFDAGLNSSKVFILVYNLTSPEQIYHLYPAIEGSAYLVAGASGSLNFGINRHESAGIVLIPIRAGVGLRWGANINYLRFSDSSSWLPF